MLIIGAQGLFLQLYDALENRNIPFTLYDDVNPETHWQKKTILKTQIQAKTYFNTGDKKFLIAIGSSTQRLKSAILFIKLGGKYIGFKGDNITCSTLSNIHPTVMILDKTTIEPYTTIGEGSLINKNVFLAHHSVIGKYVTIGPSSNILGRSAIGDSVEIGAGAIILPSVKIASNTIIGAGAIVTKDINSPGTYVGNPAKLLHR